MCRAAHLVATRATWISGAAAVLALVASAGCSGPVDAPVAAAGPTSAAQPTPSRGPAIALPAPGATAVDRDPPLTGPVDPVVGVAYP